jgi:hypothetical protein
LEISETRSHTITSIGIERIQSLVYLYRHQYVLFFGCFRQGVMILQGLYDGFRDHDMNAPMDAFQGNLKMGIVRSKDDGNITRLKGLNRLHVRLGVDLIVGRKGLDSRHVHILVHISNGLLHVFPNAGKLFAVDATHANTIDFVAAFEIQHGESDDSSALVAVGRGATHEPRRVFARSHHQNIYCFGFCRC